MDQSDNYPLSCKYCGSDTVVKFGKYRGVQRYYCKVCRRKYKGDHTLFHMKTPLDYVSGVLDMYFQGIGIAAIIKQLEIQYNYLPDRSLIHLWIRKYTAFAINYFKDFHPMSSDSWMIYDILLEIANQQLVYVVDILDEKTHFLLSSRVVQSLDSGIQVSLKDAINLVGTKPSIIHIRNHNHLDRIKKVTSKNHVSIRRTMTDNIEMEERFTCKFKGPNLSGRPFKTLRTLKYFNQGWFIFYNFFKPNHFLQGRTPAEESNIEYDVKNWHDLLLRYNGMLSVGKPLAYRPTESC